MWRAVPDQIKGPPRLVSELLTRIDSEEAIASFHSAEDISVFSDYCGEHQKIEFCTYSFLICDSRIHAAPRTAYEVLRRTRLPNNQEMAFKKLSRGHILSVLPDFLACAEQIHGLCVTLVIPRAVRNFVQSLKEDANNPLAGYTPDTQLKIHWILQTIAALANGACRDGQSLTWITDADSICSNHRQRDYLTHMLSNVLTYCEPVISRAYFATTEDPSIDVIAKDFAAIPDLLAGAWADVMNNSAARWQTTARGLYVPAGLAPKPHSHTILTAFTPQRKSLLRSIAMRFFVDESTTRAHLMKLEYG